MSFEQKIFKFSSQSGPSRVYHHQSAGKERGGLKFPQHRLVILVLGLLDVVLLIAAVVIGIYCAKAKDFENLDAAAAAPLMVELNYLRNNTNEGKIQQEAKATLGKVLADHLELKKQLREKVVVTDILQRRIEILYEERKTLKSNKTTLEESCNRCPSGWHLIKSTCYYFSQPETKKNWNDGRADCIKQGGDLVVINDLKEQQLLNDNLPKQNSRSPWWQYGFWIGLHNVTGTWMWINNTTPLNTLYWRSGQPRNSGPQSGNCAAFLYYHVPSLPMEHMYHVVDETNTWYNANCQDHQLKFICEMALRDP